MKLSSQTQANARDAFVAAKQAGDTHRAIHAARELLHGEGGVRQMSFLARELETATNWRVPLNSLKVALLSSFSIEFAQPALVVYGFLNGLDIRIYRGGFGQFRQEIIDPSSGLYAYAPDVVVLAVEGSDWIPALYCQFLEYWETGFEGLIEQTCEETSGLLQKLRSRSSATVLVHNFAPPIFRQAGILDGQKQIGQAQWVHRLNEGLAAVCRRTESAYVIDYAGVAARFGVERWYDERMRMYARAPIAADQLPHLAVEYMKYFRALRGLSKKCVVVDLDNTLWGGVLGEDGLHGIQLGSEYPGSAFMAFQKELLNLHRRGVLLAIASKNNSADVEEVFTQNKNMVLERKHFASLQVHWRPKTESIMAIAQQLNIGLEHIVFVDDNQVECEEISRALPMLSVIWLPGQPERYSQALLQDGLCDSLAISSEDLRRGELYTQRDQAEALRADSGSLEQFYRSLEMEVTITPVEKASLARAAQLTQKTNQFNATTFRYTEADLSARMCKPNWLLATVSVRDRFGDTGIVGFMMAQANGKELNIDSFLLSCRVIGRTVETAMLAYLCEQATRQSLNELTGRIIPTAKNSPVLQLYGQHGFSKSSETESGESFWKLALDDHRVAWPDWMKICVTDSARPSP
jgi:FkbH-like protein